MAKICERSVKIFESAMTLTVIKNSSDEFNVSLVQVAPSLSVSENSFSQLRKLLKASDKLQDSHFTLLGNLDLLHLTNLTGLQEQNHHQEIQH